MPPPLPPRHCAGMEQHPSLLPPPCHRAYGWRRRGLYAWLPSPRGVLLPLLLPRPRQVREVDSVHSCPALKGNSLPSSSSSSRRGALFGAGGGLSPLLLLPHPTLPLGWEEGLCAWLPSLADPGLSLSCHCQGWFHPRSPGQPWLRQLHGRAGPGQAAGAGLFLVASA